MADFTYLHPTSKPFQPMYAAVDDDSLLNAEDRAELADVELFNQELAAQIASQQLEEYEASLPPIAPASPRRHDCVSMLSPSAHPFCPSDPFLGADDFSLLSHQDQQELEAMCEVNEQLAEFAAMEDMHEYNGKGI